MSEPFQRDAVAPQQSILGYTLKERIGAGGYGEVWSAEAPGGLQKAVKLVFGYHDDNRAKRELKALDRIKDVRHPFMLSLERIDIVDGRLIVITELADKCLKDRFNECREEGFEGIGRDELLNYMREASDALDYLAETFSLAHLDIKPENLLLVGDHIKVADFGLVKDFQTVNQSLMDGLTPAYAAPELFDGKPGRFSDQYSLAIVYQEMLTGTRPFAGSTTAQLASQQLHGRPNLNSLPLSDQAVVARALAKDYKQRFAKCRDLVDELCRRRSRVKHNRSASRKLAFANLDDVTDPNFSVSAVEQRSDATMVVSESFLPAAKFESEVEKLSPFSLDSKAKMRPTLFVGVGQTATTTLKKLRRRLSDRFGTAENTPAIRILCLDTDRRSLFDETLGDSDQALQTHETMPIPLGKSDDYRHDEELDLSWIGRRWIYNIPKSQQTEGLRPLGRLAFVEHVDEIAQRLRDEIEKVASAEALATTAESLRLEPAELEPQIIFVSSISGGLGSGMLLDLAYAARVTLTSLGLPDQRVYGMLTHGTIRGDRDPRVAVANTYSFLNEFYHYNLHGYPGASYCQIPAFDDQNPAFDATYVVHLGDELGKEEYDLSIDRIAQYLYLNVATPCSLFFEQSRDVPEFDPNLVRTFGFNSLSAGRPALSERPAQIISANLLASWLTESSPQSNRADPFSANSVGNQMIEQAGFSDSTMAERFAGFFAQHLGEDPVASLMQSVNKRLQSGTLDHDQHILDSTRQAIQEKWGDPDQQEPCSVLCRALESFAGEWMEQWCAELHEACMALLDESKARLIGAESVLKWIRDHVHSRLVGLEAAQERLKHLQSECFERVTTIQSSRTCRQDESESILVIVREFIQSALDLLSMHYQRTALQGISKRLGQWQDQFDEFRQRLETVRQQIPQPGTAVSDTGVTTGQQKDLVFFIEQQVIERSESLLGELELNLQENFLVPQGGLREILQAAGQPLRRLSSVIQREASRLSCRLLEGVRIDGILRENNFTANEIATWLSQLVEEAQPSLLKCGGGSRLMLAVPQQAPVTSIAGFIENQYDHEANVIPSTCGDLVVCFEMDNMPIENIAMRLLQSQPACVELIKRLHVRNDVEWTRLTPLC